MHCHRQFHLEVLKIEFKTIEKDDEETCILVNFKPIAHYMWQ